MSQARVFVTAAIALALALMISVGANRTSNSLVPALLVLIYIGPAGMVASLVWLVCSMQSRFLSWAITSLVFFAVLWGGVVACALTSVF